MRAPGITGEDERVDQSSSSGLTNDQKKPSTEPR